MTASAQNLHREQALQDHLINQLVASQGYKQRDASVQYDRELAMDRELVVQFVQSTQPDEWLRLVANSPNSARDTFFEQLDRALQKRGLVDVLRKGIKIIPGLKFSLCYFRPASNIEPRRVQEYQANILSVMKEVKYSRRNSNRLDVVLFLNGLPIATMEIKNLLTGATFRAAEKQYRQDRPPADEPLLTFRRGALVHFALDEDNVSITTHLAENKTRFLPFSRGKDGGAGNPDIEKEFRVAWLYRTGSWGDAILSRPVLLDVIGQFIHLEKDSKKRSLIFPRFHQLDSVRKLMLHAQEQGTGQNYLIQHSAGSGKSNTISWLAHHAIKLHNSNDKPVFETVIIVTDRIVLDRQLQNTVSQFEQTQGIVKKIDGTSRDLKDAISSGARIIVTTIQKFSTEHLKEISGQSSRKFAVVVDEAHSSQSGRTAQAMTEVLTSGAATSDDVEEIIRQYQKSRGPQPNISYFAFTATPRNVTLELFGIKGSDNLPRSFHTYPMRQAIEEGFILDVLQNYMTYQAYYELEKSIDDDPKFRGREGQRKVARYASHHPTAISQKIEAIVEHFRRHVETMLDGQAKAMIVASSREQALRYYFGLKEYIAKQGYNIKALVAFSGTLDYEGEEYTEAALNGFSETELPSRFDGTESGSSTEVEQYQFLIVAEKYLTGFDQPKLCAMYVDRPLAGLGAVQALSRLNRTMRGKDNTFVLDFKNTIEEIKDAFRPYYETTGLEEISDPNLIYDLEGRLFQFDYLDKDEIEQFAQIYFSVQKDGSSRAQLEGLIRRAVDRFQADDNEGSQEEFRQLLRSYTRFYSFISQVVKLDDTSLEKLNAHSEWLNRLLPNRQVPPEIELTDDMLDMQAFKLEQKQQGSASLAPGEGTALEPISEFGATPYSEDEQKELSEIVAAFNNRHGTDFSEDDMVRVERVAHAIIDQNLLDTLRNNPSDVSYGTFADALHQGVIDEMKTGGQIFKIMLNDPEMREKISRHYFQRALRHSRHELHSR